MSTKIAFVLLVFVAAATMATHAQVEVFVPSTASGAFGNPVDQVNPLISAVTVSGPGTITVTYVSGTVNGVGPNGTTTNMGSQQLPLQEANGVAGGPVNNIYSLIGVFVPQARTNARGFQAVDGTKDVARIGILPNRLFFVGETKTFDVDQAGTFFLGINDEIVGDNSGGFDVMVSVQ
ncbi:MAG TPA: hypothetical protein VMT28_17450 [Terriglobales bacterium]|nr:hypothetical protein [Terriglobales bacterium]